MSLMLQAGTGGLNYAQRSLNQFSNSLPDAGAQSIILAFAFMIAISIVGVFILLKILKGSKQ